MKSKRIVSNAGFTIVELMVAIAMSGIVMSGIYSAYYSQQKTYTTQQQVCAMQQNLRSALFYMEREIRVAGFNPTGIPNAGIITSGVSTITVAMDITGDGNVTDADETVTYTLYNPDGDGDNDLGRDNGDGTGTQLVAENIDALDFVYLDGDGDVTAMNSDIRAVQIAIVARTGKGESGYTNSEAYSNQQDNVIYTAPGDGCRRRVLMAEVKCRNLGSE
ncbi:prepilin-type N-terminal cleavage/methylation domain-containing protein [Thermodesulfobacteriota bacterium]